MTVAPVPRSELNLSLAVTSLMKGVVYQDLHPQIWKHLVPLQPQIRDHVAVIGLTLVVDPAEGYAFLRQLPDDENTEAGQIPRLVPRRQLTFHQSIMLALLRKRLAESDSADGGSRCVLTRDQIVEMVALFLPPGSTEARMIDQVDTLITKMVDLGFLRKIRDQNDAYEIRRILKAFVDAQWLSGLQEGLDRYAIEAGAAPVKGETDD